MKARKEIADYIKADRIERARIRVEHIVREDYMVEAYEVLETYCDLILARFSLLDNGILRGVPFDTSLHFDMG